MAKPLTPRQATDQAREHIADIRDYLENLSTGTALDEANIAPGGNGTRILRSKDGKLLGEFQDAQLADFIRRAPGWLTFMINHVERMERTAFEQRARKRKLERMAKELDNADRVGFRSDQGHGYVMDAIAILREPDTDDW